MKKINILRLLRFKSPLRLISLVLLISIITGTVFSMTQIFIHIPIQYVGLILGIKQVLNNYVSKTPFSGQLSEASNAVESIKELPAAHHITPEFSSAEIVKNVTSAMPQLLLPEPFKTDSIILPLENISLPSKVHFGEIQEMQRHFLDRSTDLGYFENVSKVNDRVMLNSETMVFGLDTKPLNYEVNPQGCQIALWEGDHAAFGLRANTNVYDRRDLLLQAAAMRDYKEDLIAYIKASPAHSMQFSKETTAVNNLLNSACKMSNTADTIKQQLGLIDYTADSPFLRESPVLREQFSPTISKLQNILFNKNGSFHGIQTDVEQRKAVNIVGEYLKHTHNHNDYLTELKNCSVNVHHYFGEILEHENNSNFLGKCGESVVSVIKETWDGTPSPNFRHEILSNSYNKDLVQITNFASQGKLDEAAKIVSSYRNLSKGMGGGEAFHQDINQKVAIAQTLYKESHDKVYNSYGIKYSYTCDPVWPEIEAQLVKKHTEAHNSRHLVTPRELRVMFNNYNKFLADIKLQLEQRNLAKDLILQKLGVSHPSPLVKKIAYDVINDLYKHHKIAASLSILSQNNSREDFRKAYNIFYDKRGLLRLYNYDTKLFEDIKMPVCIGDEAYANMRVVQADLLTIDSTTPQAQAAIRQGLLYVVAGCSSENNAAHYQTLAQSVYTASAFVDTDKTILRCGNFAAPCLNNEAQAFHDNLVPLAAHATSQLHNNFNTPEQIIEHQQILRSINNVSQMAQAGHCDDAQKSFIETTVPLLKNNNHYQTFCEIPWVADLEKRYCVVPKPQEIAKTNDCIRVPQNNWPVGACALPQVPKLELPKVIELPTERLPEPRPCNFSQQTLPAFDTNKQPLALPDEVASESENKSKENTTRESGDASIAREANQEPVIVPHKIKCVIVPDFDRNVADLEAPHIAAIQKEINRIAKIKLNDFVKNPEIQAQIEEYLQRYKQKLSKPRCNIHGVITYGGKHLHVPEDLAKIIANDQDWEKLVKVFDFTLLTPKECGEQAAIWTDYEHLFGPNIKINCKTGEIVLTGFHHDYLGKIRESGLIEFGNIKPGPFETYEADWSYGEVEPKGSTFFPETWSPSKVILKIEEALKNPVGQSFELEKGNWSLVGMTSEGLKIKMIFEGNRSRNFIPSGKLISAYPFREKRI